MSYVLMVAEKPTAARRIAEVLAEPGTFRKVVSKNGVEYYEFKRNGKTHVIVAAVGHLFVLDAVDKGSSWEYPVFDVKWNETFHRRGRGFSKKYFETIQALVKGASDYWVCCDFDTEGSVIGANILKFICGVNDGKRMKFSTLTRDELRSAYDNVLPHLDFNQINAGLTRHVLDFLWGVNTTRALTLAMRAYRPKAFNVISSGRVQSPCLRLLLEKELQIRRFVPKPFWQITLRCQVNGEEIVALHEQDKFWEREAAEQVVKECKGKDAKVKEVKRKKYKQSPPIPFNTTDLQAEAYNQFGFSPTQTMRIAESLYQQGYISYPRSASQQLPPTIDYEKILRALASLTQYAKLCELLLQKEKLVPVQGKKTDPAHPCVHATSEVPKLKKLSPQQRKVYDLVARRTMAIFADPALRESMRITLSIGENNFIAKGNRTLEPGWIRFYEPYVKFKEQLLPDVKLGQAIRVVKLELLEKETKPPARYTQGSIIKELEKRNLGTRATRSEILQTLYDRGYIHGKSIEVTPLGEVVVSVLNESCPRILSEELTRHFEQQMELVYEGKKKKEDVIEEAKHVLAEILNEFKSKQEKIGKRLLEGFIAARRAARTLGKCQCGGDLIMRVSRATGKLFCGCSNYPRCDVSYPLPQAGRIEKTGKVCEHCGTPVVRVFRKGKRPFSMCLTPTCVSKSGWGKT